MKKGFTIVEIIISVSILLIVGVSTTFFVFKSNNEEELNVITKDILEAANLYASKEVDENGKIYLNEVRSGKKGIKIPLSNLVNKGYIEEEIRDEVIELSNKGDSYNYYVMLLNSNEDYCNGEIFSLASWIDEDMNKDVYLCNSSNKVDENSLYGILLSKEFYSNCNNSSIYPSLCLLKGKNSTDNGEEVLYYRGKVDNNYIKFSNSSKLFRIVRTVENNNVKIVDNEYYESGLYHKSDNAIFYWGNSKNQQFIYNSEYNLSIRYYGGSVEENSTLLTSWDDSVKMNFVRNNISYTVDNPIYKYIYSNLMNWYANEYKDILDKYIVDYKWCDTSSYEDIVSDISFKCIKEKEIESKIGLLNYFEYDALGYNIWYDGTLYDELCDFYFFDNYVNHGDLDSHCNGIDETEITMNLRDGIIRAMEKRMGSFSSSSVKKLYLRPAFVISGTSKIINGDGTKTNPYVIS